MTLVAQISDLHVLDLRGVSPLRFLNKRATGLVNLMLGRRDAHPARIGAALVEDLVEQAPDHVCVTGDLTNLALEGEFETARRLLAPLGGASSLSVVPGNHDVYTRGAQRDARFESYFADLLWCGPLPAPTERYPWFKRVGELNIVGLCSAVPRAPLMSNGVVGAEQLTRLAALGDEHDFAGRFTVVMVHHNLHARGPRKDHLHGLDDRDQVLAACQDVGVDLLLHGHTHVAHRFRRGRLRVIGCGSSTWNADEPAQVARYNLYRISEGDLESVQIRRFDASSGRFRHHATLGVDQL